MPAAIIIVESALKEAAEQLSPQFSPETAGPSFTVPLWTGPSLEFIGEDPSHWASLPIVTHDVAMALFQMATMPPWLGHSRIQICDPENVVTKFCEVRQAMGLMGQMDADT